MFKRSQKPRSRRPSPRAIQARYPVDLAAVFRGVASEEQRVLLANTRCEVLEKYRKTSSMTVKKACLVISVPVGTSYAWVEQWLLSQRSWVMRHLSAIDARPDAGFEIAQGALIPINGQHHTLTWRTGQKTRVQQDSQTLAVELSPRGSLPEPQRVAKALKAHLKAEAESRLSRAFDEWVAYMQVDPKGLHIRDYKARWGSCSHSGEVSLNWRLVHASDAMVDYVIVHELCHLKHFNHSPAFWAEVERWYPNRHWAQDQFQASTGWLAW